MTRRSLVGTLVPVYLVLIVGLPLAVSLAALAASPSWAWRLAAALAAAPLYCYLLVAGALSRLTLRAIVPGKFPRDLGHRVYGPRRLYALCWTAVYYCAPVYHAVLAVPALKRLVFRLFGYEGSLDFQCYPDTWLRDPPLLTVGPGAYLSNKATVSPNMCLQNGSILIAPVRIGARTMVGHLAMIAPGVEIGDDSEVGVGAGIGVNAQVGSRTTVDHEVVLDHGAKIGDRCTIGTRAYVGRGAVVRDGLRVPPMTLVPARAVLATQADVDALVAERSVANARRRVPPPSGLMSTQRPMLVAE
jgi:carbonic anhydrase/acetyltransferase-like protein (isoleucine patch superfamily)